MAMKRGGDGDQGDPGPVRPPPRGPTKPSGTTGPTGTGSTGTTGAAGAAGGAFTPYHASDGSALSVQLDAQGQVTSASGTGVDGVSRRYWVDPSNRSVQHYTAAADLALTVGITLDRLRQVITLTSEAGPVRLSYRVDCAGASDADSADAAMLAVTATRFQGGAQADQQTRQVASSDLSRDYGATFAAAHGPAYQQLVLFFQPLLGDLLKQRAPSPADRSTWGKIGRGILWGLGGLAVGVFAAPLEGVAAGLTLGISFLAGFDASLASDVVSDWENQKGPFDPNAGDTGASGTPTDAGGDTGAGDGGIETQGGEGSGGSGGGGGDGCFVRGTPVLLERGLVAIDQVRPEDRIQGWDLTANAISTQAVAKVHESLRAQIVVLELGGEAIRCTPPHRFFTGRWVPAQELRPGDAVMGKDGRWHPILAVRREEVPQPVFNLTVTAVHTYLVGEAGLVVHNTKVENPQDGTGTGTGAGEGSSATDQP